MLVVRPAAVAGMFYPADADALRAQVARCLDEAPAAGPGSTAPKMLVVPHAGYVYSGPIAARAYALLAPMRETVRRVVLLGPVHRVPVLGLAVPTADAFDTPLGRVPLDRAALDAVARLPQVVADDRPHAPEHSLEVQLPFLQRMLGRFSLVPLAVGDATPDEVAEVLELLWGGPETLIVVSTDLSHYLPYMQARQVDRATVERIVALESDLTGHQACGARGLNGALRAARRHGLQAQVLDLRNSGDTAGDRGRVVGYAAIAFGAAPEGAGATAPDTDAALGPALLAAARQAIAERLGEPARATPDHPALHQPGASFVTLHDAAGRLRGCIGGLTARQALIDDLRHHAVAAAFHDPRFAPVTRAEWPTLALEVSLLEAPQPMPAAGEADALAQLRPTLDGVVLEWRGHHATFLPQVWEQLREPRDFLAALKRKAGLAPDFWADDLVLSRYRVRTFR